MKKINLFVYLLLFASLFSGCIERSDYKGCHKPIYLSYEELRSDFPKVVEPREIDKAGKIYVYGDIILVNEKNIGIHIVDNRVKETPIRKYFIEIPGNIDMEIKDDYLYVDSYTDLVVLNIKDIENISEVKNARKEGIFPYSHTIKKEDLNKDICSYDEDRGIVVGYK